MSAMPAYQLTFQTFFTDYGKVHEQRYVTLIKRIKERRDTIGDSIVPSNPYAGANAAHVKPTPGPKGKPAAAQQPSPRGAKPWPSAKEVAHCKGYCVDHGFGGHNSCDCSHKDAMSEAARATDITNFRNQECGSRYVAPPQQRK
jgi:hypothetical protein